MNAQNTMTVKLRPRIAVTAGCQASMFVLSASLSICSRPKRKAAAMKAPTRRVEGGGIGLWIGYIGY
jgi:hypothetical protein